VNLIDTAADSGESEAILGRALTGVARDSYVLCTKFKPVENLRDPASGPEALNDAAELERSVDQSLQRLHTDHIDVLYLHGVTPDWYAQVRDRFLPELNRQRALGKIRFVGITERFIEDPHTHPTLQLALRDDVYDVMMVGYNMLLPGAEAHVLPEAQRRDVGIVVMVAVSRVLASSALLEERIAELKAQGALGVDALPDRGPLDWLVHGDVESLTSAAYRFAADHPAVSCVLTGTARPDHLEQNVSAALRGPLPAEDRARLRELFGGRSAERITGGRG
jgi:L-galactose dehydrogenase